MPGLADGSVRRRWAACSLHQCLAVHDSSRVLCRAGAEDSAFAPFGGQVFDSLAHGAVDGGRHGCVMGVVHLNDGYAHGLCQSPC